MNATDDPLIIERQREKSARNGLIRSAIIWTPLFLASFGGFLFFFFDEATGGDRGSWFLVIVLGIFSILFGSQSLQSIGDLVSKPVTMEGDVTRRWTRNDSLVVRTHYVRVGKQILRGDKLMLNDIDKGQRVAVRFHKHSGVLIAIERLPDLPKPAPAPAAAVDVEPEPETPAPPRKQADRSFWE